MEVIKYYDMEFPFKMYSMENVAALKNKLSALKKRSSMRDKRTIFEKLLPTARFVSAFLRH